MGENFFSEYVAPYYMTGLRLSENGLPEATLRTGEVVLCDDLCWMHNGFKVPRAEDCGAGDLSEETMDVALDDFLETHDFDFDEAMTRIHHSGPLGLGPYAKSAPKNPLTLWDHLRD